MEVDGKPISDASYYDVMNQLKGNGKKDVALGFKRHEKDGNDKLC